MVFQLTDIYIYYYVGECGYAGLLCYWSFAATVGAGVGIGVGVVILRFTSLHAFMANLLLFHSPSAVIVGLLLNIYSALFVVTF